jgi:O-antigen ligase
LRLTFLNANLACNYLTVSLMLLLAAGHLKWIGKTPFRLLFGGIIIAAATTISPGLGGIALALGLWMWVTLGARRAWTARLFLVSGVAAAVLFVAAMAVTPILHPTAPFLITVPGFDVTLAPAGRLMIWMDALGNFTENPVFGRGIGSDAVSVEYRDPSGNLQQLTDAHNVFLSIAVQCGLVGLAALIGLVFHIGRRTLPLRLPDSAAGVVRLAAGLGLLNGLVYQGLGGSFEDARHVWFALGLLLASSRIQTVSTGSA